MRPRPRNALSVRQRTLVVLVASASAVACAPDQRPSADSAVAQPAAAADRPVPVATGGSAPDTSCHKEGLWTSCAVEDRLVRAGLVVKTKDEPARYPFFAVTGTTYGVGAGEDEVRVFLYSSEVARRADSDKLDSAAVSPKGERLGYKVPPLLVTSNNLTAVVFTLNERARERIALALSAGLSQPRR